MIGPQRSPWKSSSEVAERCDAWLGKEARRCLPARQASQSCSTWDSTGRPRTRPSLPILRSAAKLVWPNRACQRQASSFACAARHIGRAMVSSSTYSRPGPRLILARRCRCSSRTHITPPPIEISKSTSSSWPQLTMLAVRRGM